MNEDPDREEEILQDALRIPAGSERDAYLNEACGGDEEMRREIEELLVAAAKPASAIRNVGDLAAAANMSAFAQDDQESDLEQPGDTISHYTLLQRLGEGGFGVVYLAEQAEPVRRQVALKVIKAGMDTRSVITRFEAERQALAMMDHPNIARVLDAGATDRGRPYFVMDLVQGIPITDYCDQAELGSRQRLELFLDVCSAVQHSHQKGIIHRDLKPSNILVTRQGGKPVVKVIDFGVAKATEHKLTKQTFVTACGQIVGTPAYMSPEQAVMSGLDIIDTRSDVFSLGVLLYELLAGVPPFEAERLRSAGIEEMCRIVREEDAPKPSTRLRTLDEETQLRVAARRHLTPAALSRHLHGELDWIVMKALEKERERRYESAGAFAKDVRAHLNAEPVMAGAPSRFYKLRKFVRRHRGPAAAATGMAALLIAGTMVSTFQAARAREARDAEAAARERAEERLSQIEKSNEILGSIFNSLDPEEISAAGRPLQAILAENLDRAARELDGEAIGDPLIVAGMQNRLGHSLLKLGEAEKAIAVLEKALATYRSLEGPHHREKLESAANLANAYGAAGQSDRAILLLEPAVKEAASALGDDDPHTLTMKNNLAFHYQDMGRFKLAGPLLEEILEAEKAKYGPRHPRTLHVLHNLAGFYYETDKPEESVRLFEEVLEAKEAELGPTAPSTLRSLNNVALVYRSMGDFDRALPLFEQVVDRRTQTLGKDHPETLRAMNNLAANYWSAGRLDESVPQFEEVLKLTESKLGRTHPETLATVANLGVNYRDAGRLEEALPLVEEAYEGLKDHPGLSWVAVALLQSYARAGMTDKTITLGGQIEATLRERFPEDRLYRAPRLEKIGSSYLKAEAFVEAERVFREAARGRETPQPDTWAIFNTRSMLGGALLKQEKFAEAEPLLVNAFEGMTEREEAIPRKDRSLLREALERLVEFYEARGETGDRARAEEYRRKLEARTESESPAREESTEKD